MNSDQPSREQIELRLTALLLGELPDEEAALLRYTMAQDPALQQLHDELQATLGLVREAAKHPANPAAEKNAPQTLKLSAERRQQLLAHFKTSRPPSAAPPLFWLKRIEVPRLIPVLVAVACIALLAAMLLPALSRAKTKAQRGASYGVNSLSAKLNFTRTWSADNQDRVAMKVSPASPPKGALVEAKLAPEPQLAPLPVATPPVEIVLPQSESSPEIAAQAGAPVEAVVNVPAAGNTSSQLLPPSVPAGSVPPPGTVAPEQLTLNYRDGNKTFDKPEPATHLENQWTVPAQALDSSVSRSTVAGGTGGGGGAFGGFGGSAGNYSGTFSAGATGVASLPAVPTASAAPQSLAITANGISPIYAQKDKFNIGQQPRPQLPKEEPPMLASAYQLNGGALQSRAVGGAADNRFYRSPAQEVEEKKTPLLGDIPIVGSLFQGSAQSSKPAPVAAPAPAAPAPPAATTALGFDFKAGNLNSGVANGSFNTGATKDELPLLGLATAGSVNLVEKNKLLDAERARELQNHQPNQQDTGLYLPPNVTVVARSATQESHLGDLQAQFQDQEKQIRLAQDTVDALRQKLHVTDHDPHAAAPSPTMDAQQLQMINSQRIEQEKVYHEQSVQLQELKALEKTNKDRLAEVMPQMVQDATLKDLLSKRQEASRKLTTQTTDLSATDGTVARNQADLEGLNREIDGREAGILAGLETRANSTKAALEAMNASVAEAQKKDQQEAQKNQPYYDAQRELQQKLKMHELLYAKMEAEKLDLSLPDNSVVQITDPAQPGRSQNFWQRLTGQVESTARVKVEKDVTDIPGLAGTPAVASFDPYFIQITFEIIQSEVVLGKAVDALNLQSVWASKNGGEKLTKSEAIAQLKQRLDLQPIANTKLIEIGAKSNDPKEAANIANAVAKAYADYRAESRRQSSANGLAALKNQLGQQSKEIQLAQAKVDRLGKDLAPKQKVTEPAPEPADLPLRKPAPNAPVPQPEVLTRDNNFSTFSLNVSDVSFKFAEASLQNGKLPDTASIRSEEFINAFDYRDPEAAAGLPMAFTSERARYPFAHNRELLRFAVKTAAAGRPAGRALNLVLLLDRSGSMERADRVAIIRESLRVLATQLQPQDTVSVVTFARTARLWADGISGDKAGATLDQVGNITPEGGTNLEEAMRLAYETAHRHYLPNGLNRVVLLTDGAANLGNVEPSALRQKVELQRKQGIALDCFGIGWEDYNDDLLEQLSSHGDGRYAFLNSPEDASKDFATKLAGALQIAAADVKVQVEFNPGRVLSYRQIGYARHQLTKEQFRDNTVAAGEIASQEAGNALYTIETNPNGDGPIATVHVRYRIPGTTDYREHSWDVAYTGSAPALDHSSPGMRLAATASAFSEWLAASPYAQEVTLDELLKDLRGVPEVYGADDRPKQLETMLREAKSLEGK